jgi:hypothetical protein
MKLNATIATLIASLAVVGLAAGTTQKANAGELGSSWNYQYDAVGDGSGGSAYDIKGMAMKIDGNNLIVALTGGTPLAGVQHAGVTNGTIAFGDLFFNFSGKSFADAAASGNLFGIRFAQSNDSAVGLGVYSNVKTTSVAGQNSGYSSLQQYYDYGWNKDQTQGSAIATKEAAYNYYGTGAIQNSIASGNKIGDIAMLMGADLSAMGLNFGNSAGSETYGFKLDKSLLPSGSFLANLYLECGNDGMAFSASAAPEPTTMAGAALGAAAIAGLKRRRRQQQQAAE